MASPLSARLAGGRRHRGVHDLGPADPRNDNAELVRDAIEQAVGSARAVVLASVGADHVFPTTPAAVAWAQSVADAPAPR
jgi:hypothetical protein